MMCMAQRAAIWDLVTQKKCFGCVFGLLAAVPPQAEHSQRARKASACCALAALAAGPRRSCTAAELKASNEQLRARPSEDPCSQAKHSGLSARKMHSNPTFRCSCSAQPFLIKHRSAVQIVCRSKRTHLLPTCRLALMQQQKSQAEPVELQTQTHSVVSQNAVQSPVCKSRSSSTPTIMPGHSQT